MEAAGAHKLVTGAAGAVICASPAAVFPAGTSAAVVTAGDAAVNDNRLGTDTLLEEDTAALEIGAAKGVVAVARSTVAGAATVEAASVGSRIRLARRVRRPDGGERGAVRRCGIGFQ
eukprot:TRINITY_DN12416_c0_g1_i1.p3 TRINITY_DN12416_c0_g1~~TRINITY_DN12416_c0_g1_i1.p3  ORF type:complete len:117 (-),score=6.58 TRINITY_DN12416_c0_g1_i1:55-405(-)